MEIFVILFMLTAIFGTGMVVTGKHPTRQSLRAIPGLKLTEAKAQGRTDMRRAVEKLIVTQDYAQQKQAIIEANKRHKQARYSGQNDDFGYYMQEATSESDALENLQIKYNRAVRRVGEMDIETVASHMVKWETANKTPYPVDPAIGQTSEYYFGSEGALFDAYIDGGMEYLKDLDRAKSIVVDRTTTTTIRKSAVREVNRQYVAFTESRHMLQIESIVTEQEKFDKRLKELSSGSE